MLDIALLGTGGMMPLPKRHVTSCMLRYNGAALLIDCGEGTQIALREKGWSFKNINTILITHFHADHIAGLPGFLLTMGNADRTEPLTVIGPKGLRRIMQAVRVLAPELPFDILCEEIEGSAQNFMRDGMEIHAFRLQHNVTCYGYSVSIHRTGRFDVEKAKANDIPLRFWNPLQKGQTISFEGRTLTPDMVLGGARKGLKILYATDTRPVRVIAEEGRGCDLMILEGMYGEEDKVEKAVGYKHMTMQEAAKIAAAAKPKELWLTHFSPSVTKADYYKNEIREIFPDTVIPKDGRSIELRFSDEEEG